MRAEFSGESFQDEDKARERVRSSSVYTDGLEIHLHKPWMWPVYVGVSKLVVTSTNNYSPLGCLGEGGEFLRYKYGVEGQVQGTL